LNVREKSLTFWEIFNQLTQHFVNPFRIVNQKGYIYNGIKIFMKKLLGILSAVFIGITGYCTNVTGGMRMKIEKSAVSMENSMALNKTA